MKLIVSLCHALELLPTVFRVYSEQRTFEHSLSYYMLCSYTCAMSAVSSKPLVQWSNLCFHVFVFDFRAASLVYQLWESSVTNTTTLADLLQMLVEEWEPIPQQCVLPSWWPASIRFIARKCRYNKETINQRHISLLSLLCLFKLIRKCPQFLFTHVVRCSLRHLSIYLKKDSCVKHTGLYTFYLFYLFYFIFFYLKTIKNCV